MMRKTMSAETPHGIRTSVMDIYIVLVMARSMPTSWTRFREMLLCIWYSTSQCYTRKKRSPMDIPAMVAGWHRVVLAMSTGHTKDDVDHAEFAMEELMAPLLTAPVKQLRAFWVQLEATLKADPQVPFVVWRMFEAYGEVVVKDATDQAIIELKTTLAREIAELVEQDARPDISTAIEGALRWRSPEALLSMKEELKNGTKPRIVGRESCLFLQCGDEILML